MQKRSEGHFRGTKSANLFYQNWQVDDAVATLVMTHGMGEHSESYQFLARGLEKYKLNLSVWDLRGHGKSDGKRGYVDQFMDFVNDLDCFMKHLQSQNKLDLPYFLSGHSLGGLITLRYILENGIGQAKGICLSSPQLGIALAVPPIKDFFATNVLNRFLPSLTLHNEIDFNVLTHDKDIVKSMRTDPFRHDKISSGVYVGMLENMKVVNDRCGKVISGPILMQLAGDDHFVSRPACEAFFKTIASDKKELIIYDGAYHEIFNETTREKTYKDLNQFIVKTLGRTK